MSGEAEAAADTLSGAILASTVEGAGNTASSRDAVVRGACRNCGSALTGAFCCMCGQRAHLHRSILSLGHDLLHGVLHLEGKIWRTLPELFLHPGRLTRRYIDGERAKFVSPMALYLFTVFLMFAVFSFTTSSFFERTGEGAATAARSLVPAIEAMEYSLVALRAQVGVQDGERRTKLVQQIGELERKIAEVRAERARLEAWSKANGGSPAASQAQARDGKLDSAGDSSRSALPREFREGLPRQLSEALRRVSDNPSLALYKAKAAAYKYSWALIPLSVPFLWLLFFWRRDIHLYDHAIFVTYSISFMMLFLVLVSLAAAFGASSAIWGNALWIVPPVHLYRQLRRAYGLSRAGTWLRLFLLTIVIGIVLGIFVTGLLLIGILG